MQSGFAHATTSAIHVEDVDLDGTHDERDLLRQRHGVLVQIEQAARHQDHGKVLSLSAQLSRLQEELLVATV